jgi:hypothetical protein
LFHCPNQSIIICHEYCCNERSSIYSGNRSSYGYTSSIRKGIVASVIGSDQEEGSFVVIHVVGTHPQESGNQLLTEVSEGEVNISHILCQFIFISSRHHNACVEELCE